MSQKFRDQQQLANILTKLSTSVSAKPGRRVTVKMSLMTSPMTSGARSKPVGRKGLSRRLHEYLNSVSLNKM